MGLSHTSAQTSQQIYQQMWSAFETALFKQSVQIDQQINNPLDTRRGITALAYLINNSEPSTAAISAFMQEVKQLHSEQYFYPADELHLTLLSIISCLPNFKLSDIHSPDYVRIFKRALADCQSIKIHFKGVTASPQAILIQGFACDNSLQQVRDNLRRQYIDSGLFCNADSRYKITAAHLTAIRFTTQLKDPQALYQLLKKYKEHDFGVVEFSQLELVFNNWYQQKSAGKNLSCHLC